MIKSVTVTNYLNESIKLELMYPEKSGFVITNIDGLGPGKATINTTKSATSDGAQYNSARLDERNIVITLQFLAKPTIEYIRQQSYKYFPIKKQVKLVFETDNRTCEIYGNVESNEPVIFSNKETTQISIICPDPYFYSSGPKGITTTIFYGVDPIFEFPFSNESLTEDLIEFGSIKLNTEQTIYYTGDCEIGITITIHAVGEASNITIYNTRTRETMVLYTDKLVAMTGSGIIAGDEIVITTVKGAKSITLLRNGEYINIMNCLDMNSDWFQLIKGDDLFAYSAESGSTNLQFKIENQTAYEGL